jgi:copper chaperone CopZ
MVGFGLKKKVFAVGGMTCHHCEMTVEKALLELQGVTSAKANHDAKTVEVQFKGELDLEAVSDKIEKAGYKFLG